MTTLNQAAPASPSQLHTLTEINIQDFLIAFGLENLHPGRDVLDALCWLPARRFASQIARYDRMVGEDGLGPASRRILSGYVRRLEVEGQENIPQSGPLLLLSNHPGLTDALSLFASIPRPDLRAVAAERPFLRVLPSITRHLLYVPDDPSQRMRVVRAVVGHLRHGGAVLTFPAGQIEPDPASMPGAVASLHNWSESVAIFTRLVPETQVVVAIVSGVFWPAALRSPLTRLRRRQPDRERMGAALQALVQTLLPFYQPVATRVAYSPAFHPAELAGSTDTTAITQAITGQARRLIEGIQNRNVQVQPMISLTPPLRPSQEER
jgi:1-acyl-sn-glycerol-3-phosphate acyltransferase